MFYTLRSRSKVNVAANSLTIKLPNERSFRPGATLEGTITLTLVEAVELRALFVTLIGIADNATHHSVGIAGPVFAHERSNIYPVNGLGNTATSAGNSGDQPTLSLAVGDHSWPFTLKVPVDQQLPSSMESHRNQVYYVVRGAAWQMNGPDMVGEIDIRIRDPVYIDHEPYRLPVVQRCPFQRNKAARWLAEHCGDNAARPRTTDTDTFQGVTLWLARSGYRPGERLRLMLGCPGAPANTAPLQVKARLRRLCVHRSETLVDVEDVVVAGGQRPLAESTGLFELQLPRRMLSSSRDPGALLNGLGGGGCVTVRYTLEVVVRQCAGPALLPKPVARFRVPVVIGTYSAEAILRMNRRSGSSSGNGRESGDGHADPWTAWWRSVVPREVRQAEGIAEEDLVEALPLYEPPPPTYDIAITSAAAAATAATVPESRRQPPEYSIHYQHHY